MEEIKKQAHNKALQLCLNNGIADEKIITLVESAYLIGHVDGISFSMEALYLED
jgi:hypothetical protein